MVVRQKCPSRKMSESHDLGSRNIEEKVRFPAIQVRPGPPQPNRHHESAKHYIIELGSKGNYVHEVPTTVTWLPEWMIHSENQLPSYT